MSAASRFKYFYLAYASKPKFERFLYRAIRKGRATRFVELGMTSIPRTRRMIEVAQRFAPSGKVSFTGIDLFEAASHVTASSLAVDEQPQSLLNVYRQLKPAGVALRLIPGTLGGVLPNSANSLPGTDVLMIAHTITDIDLEPAWYYLPRMLHPGSLVLRERAVAESELTLESISLAQVQRTAALPPRQAA